MHEYTKLWALALMVNIVVLWVLIFFLTRDVTELFTWVSTMHVDLYDLRFGR